MNSFIQLFILQSVHPCFIKNGELKKILLYECIAHFIYLWKPKFRLKIRHHDTSQTGSWIIMLCGRELCCRRFGGNVASVFMVDSENYLKMEVTSTTETLATQHISAWCNNRRTELTYCHDFMECDYRRGLVW
jgi:hypothetical protein